MTARQQIARLLPLVLLVVLVIAGLRGVVPAPGWNGPLKAYGVAIGIALEVVFGALLLVVRARDAAARRAAESRPYDPADGGEGHRAAAGAAVHAQVPAHRVHARRRGRPAHRPPPALLRQAQAAAAADQQDQDAT